MPNDTKVNLSQATRAQLAAHASTVLGLDVGNDESAAQIRARILQAAPDAKEIVIPGGAEPNPEAQRARLARAERAATAEPGKVWLMIQTHEDVGGDEPVPVGVNGRVMLIPRGKPVEVPVPYYEVLKNAVTYRYDPVEGGGLSEPRKVPAYPFSLVPPPIGATQAA